MIMYIVWSCVIALALLIEFLTFDLITIWFAGGGIIALILAACGVLWMYQLAAFFVVSLICILLLRNIFKKYIHIKTTPTNIDVNIGHRARLLSDVIDGKSEIKINDIFWTVVCEQDLKAGETVEITGINGNKFSVVKAQQEDKKNQDKEVISETKTKVSATKKPKEGKK